MLLHFIRDDIHALPLVLMYLRRHYRLATILQLFAHVYEYIVEEALNEGVN